MDIQQNGSNELIITGNIKTVEDSIQLKNALNKMATAGNSSIHLKIIDSMSMTSTAIGYLMKLVNIEHVKLSVTAGDERLYVLLEELGLLQLFNVRLTRS